MLKDHFIHQFKYNDWATKKAAESIIGFEEKDERLNELLSHIISSQKVWLSRTLLRDIYLNPWEKYSTQKCIDLSTEITAEWINLLEGFSDIDFEKRIDYKNTKGEKFVNTVLDIATHIINHSTYHRGQIAQKVRVLGGTPAVTDYIFYQREFY
jgi:uncharacterized damage-inducible protein DinB